MEVDRLTDFIGEALEHADGLDGEADVRFVRELMPHAAGVAAGRSGGEHLLALEEHNVGHAAQREMTGDARADAAAADDHDVGGGFHDWVRGSGFKVLGSFVRGSGFGVRGSEFGVRSSEFGVRYDLCECSGNGRTTLSGSLLLAAIQRVEAQGLCIYCNATHFEGL